MPRRNTDMERDKILESNPLIPFMESRGIVFRGKLTNRCALMEHKPGHFCVSVEPAKQLWNCHDCGAGGTIIDFVMMADGLTSGQAMEKLGGPNGHTVKDERAAVRAHNVGTAAPGPKPKISKTYDYTDAKGALIYQVVRLEPKGFRQRQKDASGGWVWNLDGVTRVLFNLPKIIGADVIFVCEGEKDCETLGGMGLVATTNVGGAKKWDASYTAYFRGKEAVLLPDNDKAGQEHLELVKTALSKVSKSMRIVQMPEGIKDVSDFAATFATIEDAKDELIQMCEAAECLHKGESVPIQTMAEMEVDYRAYIKRSASLQFHLSDWLPSFKYFVRPLVPGELVMILASTGTGKTAILQNIAMSTRLETLMIEKELPNTLTFERFVGLATNSTGAHVESTYQVNGSKDWRGSKKLDHIVCCFKRMSPNGIAKLIDTTALKTSVRPVLVLVDYIQLIQGNGERYERTSDAAEELKHVAKETNTIIVTASQISRKDKKKDENEATREVRLTDGKDSGSIENSAGLVLGAWRDASDDGRLWLRVLKNTKGRPGRTIPCRMTETLLITEEAHEPA